MRYPPSRLPWPSAMSSPRPEISEATRRLLALSMLKGVGPATLRKVSHLPGLATLPVAELATTVPLLGKALGLSGAWDDARRAADEQEEQAGRHDAAILSVADAGYPTLLARTPDDPAILFIKGRLSSSVAEPVAVIGTREPTVHGVEITRRIVKHLVGTHRSIISGLALGCDAVAHQAALDAGGHTVAVLAHGLQTIAPTKHRALAQAIVDAGGALVSQYPFGTQALPQLFVERDKTQAGLSGGVVMVQSDLRGGSLHASRAALAYGRWLAVPYPTVQDVVADEPKIQANLVIANGIQVHRAALLRCTLDALERVFVLRGRDDYRLLDDRPGDASAGTVGLL